MLGHGLNVFAILRNPHAKFNELKPLEHGIPVFPIQGGFFVMNMTRIHTLTFF